MSRNVPRSKKVGRFKYQDLKPEEFGFREAGESVITVVGVDGSVRKESIPVNWPKKPVKNKLKNNPKTIMVDEELQAEATEEEVEAEEAAEAEAEEAAEDKA